MLCALSCEAATNLLSLTYVNGTNNGAAVAVTNVVFPKQEFIFQTLGITNVYGGSYLTNGVTNAIAINLQYSVDAANSNWITLATWTPDSTNALVEDYATSARRITLSVRAQVITTNALGAAVFQK